MAIRSDAYLPVRAGGTYGVQAPKAVPAASTQPSATYQADHLRVATPVSAATPPSAAGVLGKTRKSFEIIDALTHPLRVIKGAWQWGTSIFKFDRLGAITSENAGTAQGTLAAAREGLDKIGLAKVLPFLSNAIEKRAAKALTELRPDVERQISAKAGHPVHIVWPVGGSWAKALDELVLFDQTFQEAEPAAVMKALAGISEINVQKLSVVDWFNPIRKQAATLFIQRPLEWAPGQKPMEDVLKAYFTQVTSVQVAL